MTTKLFISRLVKSSVALGSIAIISQSIDSMNPQLTTASAQNPRHLLSNQTVTTISLQTNPKNLTHQPVTTAGISLGWVGGIFLGLGVFGLSAIAKKGIVVIGNNEVGIVIKKFNYNPFFPKLPAGQLIALKGEAGPQAKILTPGLHWGYFSRMYIIRKEAIITISSEEIGLVVAKDGANMQPGQHFGKFVECNNFQNADAFIENGGQKGKQLAILTPGTYRINTELFKISKKSVIYIPQGQIGLVVAKDGAEMPPEQLLGKVVDCSHFQNASAFMTNGGQKGRQLAILTIGTHQINTDLFTVITAGNATQYGMKPKDLQVYTVEAGKIGIVTTYDGISIKPDEIAGLPTPDHGNFQNGQKFDVKIAELNAIAAKYGIEVEIERVRQLREIEIVVLEKTIDIIGREGWLDVEKLKELVKLKLPEVWVSNSHDGGSGLIDAVMPQVLRTLKTTTIGATNNLAAAHLASQTRAGFPRPR